MGLLGRNKEKIISGLFYVGLTIELLIVLVDKSALLNPWEGQLFRVTFLLFAVKVCFTRYSRKEWLFLVGLVALGAGFYFHTGENIILRLVVFVAAMKGMALKPVLKSVFWITLGGSLLLVALSVAGLLGGISLTGEFRQGVVETRYCFGMGHPNALHCMFLMLMLLFLYIYGEKLKTVGYIILFAGNWGLFYFTDSKTGFGMTALAIAAAFILAKGVKLRQTAGIYLLGVVFFLGCIGISVWAAQYTEKAKVDPVIEIVDRILSGRIKTLYWGSAVHAGALTSWRLFSDASHFAYYFDMGWIRMFYWYGILPGILFTVLHVLLLVECKRKKDSLGLVMIVALAFYTVMEAHIISNYLARNYLLFLFGAYGSDLLRVGNAREGYWWNLPKWSRL